MNDPGRHDPGKEPPDESRRENAHDQAHDDAQEVGGPSARPQRRARTSSGEASSPRLPHERDESNDSQSSVPRRILERAHEDIEQGQQDTDRRGTPGYEKPENQAPNDARPAGADRGPASSGAHTPPSGRKR